MGGGGGGCGFFFFKQKTAYEMCGRDWSSDVCSSDLPVNPHIHNTCVIHYLLRNASHQTDAVHLDFLLSSTCLWTYVCLWQMSTHCCTNPVLSQWTCCLQPSNSIASLLVTSVFCVRVRSEDNVTDNSSNCCTTCIWSLVLPQLFWNWESCKYCWQIECMYRTWHCVPLSHT